MRAFLKAIMYIHLYIMVKIILFIKKPKIILIAWTDKKSIVRYKIINELEKLWEKVHNPKWNFNTWFGILLTILDLPTWNDKTFPWINIYFLSLGRFFKYLSSFSKYLILEVWIDQSDEAKKFTRLLSPHILVLTTLSHQLWDDYRYLNMMEIEFLDFVRQINKWGNDIIKIIK